MGQQYELKLLDDAQARAGARPLTDVLPGRELSVVDAAPTAAHQPYRVRALKAQPSFLPENAVAAEAFRLTLLQCKWHITANIPAVEAQDVEGVHQLRVGLRRLRVALSSFGGDFRSPQVEAIRIRAKILAARLAPARDLDVFAEQLFEPAATANGALEAFEVLRTRARTLRKSAWHDAVSLIGGPGFRVFLADLNETIDRRLPTGLFAGEAHATRGLQAFEVPCASLADRMLTHRLGRARKRARRLESLSDSERHDLRIALKKLRYTAEFFAPFYDKRKVEKFLARLSRMQDVLGALNDVAVARKTLDALVTSEDVSTQLSQAEISFAAGIVYGWHLQRAACLWSDAVSRWKKFARTEPFWNEVGER